MLIPRFSDPLHKEIALQVPFKSVASHLERMPGCFDLPWEKDSDHSPDLCLSYALYTQCHLSVSYHHWCPINQCLFSLSL